MSNVIYNENQRLKLRLDNLIKQARTNEKKQAVFDQFGFDIIAANSPQQLKDLLLYQMQVRFQLQEVVLCLIDEKQDMEHLFYGDNQDLRAAYQYRLHLLDVKKDPEKIRSLKPMFQLGEGVLDDYGWMLGKQNRPGIFKSAAMIPLIRADKIIGGLLLVSGNAERYQKTHAITFLQRLSVMISVAVENCLNQQRIKEISYQDALTHTYNRRYFDLRIKDEIERSLRFGEELSCMFVDIDLFKNVNDTYGHHIGDIVLADVASIIKEQVRACDVAARYGGEEFVILLPSTGTGLAVEIAERLRTVVSERIHSFYDKTFSVTISLGVASLNHELELASKEEAIEFARRLLENADKALYQAKKSGRNKVILFEE